MFFIFLAIHDYQFFNSDEQEIQNIKKQLFLRQGHVKFRDDYYFSFLFIEQTISYFYTNDKSICIEK
jgi:hypothetical protein